MTDADTLRPAPPPPEAAAPARGYLGLTRTATYGFVSALPLLALYEGMILLANQGRAAQVRVSADVWIKYVLALVGVQGLALVGLAVAGVGAWVLWRERGVGVRLRPRYFAGMLAESAVYAVVVAMLVSTTVGWLFARMPAAPQAMGLDLWTELALSIGAGLYEELLFRVLLVGGLYAVLRRLTPRPAYAYVVAAVVGALLFSAVHYVGALGDVFTLPSFTFRFLFGLALNVLFLARGFGIAAWTHALYDVLVVTHLLG